MQNPKPLKEIGALLKQVGTRIEDGLTTWRLGLYGLQVARAEKVAAARPEVLRVALENAVRYAQPLAPEKRDALFAKAADSTYAAYFRWEDNTRVRFASHYRSRSGQVAREMIKKAVTPEAVSFLDDERLPGVFSLDVIEPRDYRNALGRIQAELKRAGGVVSPKVSASGLSVSYRA